MNFTANDSKKVLENSFSEIKKTITGAFNLLQAAVESNSYYLINYLLVIRKVRGLKVEVAENAIREKLLKDFQVSSDAAINEVLKSEFSDILSQISDIVLIEIIEKILEISEENFNRHQKELFDFLLRHIALSHFSKASAGYQPNELSQLMTSIYPLPTKAKVYNPFAGFASFATFLPKDVIYYGQELDKSIRAIGLLRLINHDVETNCIFNLEDSIKNWNPENKAFDFIIASPPFGLRLSKEEREKLNTQQRTVDGFVVEKAIESLSSRGKAVLLIPGGFLYSENKEEAKLRKYIVESDLLEMVITMPNRVLFSTAIHVNLLVLNKAKAAPGKVSFLNAESFVHKNGSNQKTIEVEKILKAIQTKIQENKVFDSSLVKENPDFIYQKISPDKKSETVLINTWTETFQVVDNNLIVANDYDIHVNRYLIPQIEGVELGRLFKIVPQTKVKADSVRKVVKIKNLKDDPIAYQESFTNLMPSVPKAGAYEIIGKALLLSLFGNKLRPTLFNKEDEKIVISRDILACEINESLIDPDYLIQEMHAEYFQEQLTNYSSGSIMPTLRKTDVLKLKLKMPPSFFKGDFKQSLAEQKAEAKGAKEAIFMARIKEAGLEDQIRLVSSNFEEALRLKKHNLLQHHNNIKSSISALKTLLDQEGAIKASDYIFTNTNVEEHVKMVYESALMFGNLIENLTEDEKFDEKEMVNVSEMLADCMKAFNRPSLFDYDYFFDEASFRLDTDQLRKKIITPLIEIGKNDFQELFNNIIENAIRHGFVGEGKKYLLHISLTYNEETSNVEILFANNGKPFPQGIDKKFYSLKGEKAGPTGRTGYGGHRVSTIVSHYSGRLDVIDDSTSNFPVKIIVGFPIKIEADEI